MGEYPRLEIEGRSFLVVPEEDMAEIEARLDSALAAAIVARGQTPDEDLLTAEEVEQMAEVGLLRYWRERRGLTGARLADEAGISQPYLSEIETGKKDGGLMLMKKIAGILRVPLDTLVR